MVKKDNSYQKTTNLIKTTLIIVSLIFLTVGCFEITSILNDNGIKTSTCDFLFNDSASTAKATECEYYAQIDHSIRTNFAKQNIFYSIALSVLVATGAFIYHRHTLPEKEW